MITFHQVSVSFQGDALFEAVSFQVKVGDRIGLVGKNGAGKSTLLKVIADEQVYDTGSIAKEKDTTIGFLKQDIDFEKGRTVLEEAYQAFTEIKQLETTLNTLQEAIANRTDYESESYQELLVELAETQDRFEIIGGYTYAGQAEQILLGLGFKRTDFNAQTDTFSGGWRMRIELAKLLLQKNDVLLLDEPTNHLDIESILWLEQFLKSFTGAVILVSHDKEFLDQVTNRTIEINSGKIYDFPKSYSQYKVARALLQEQQLAAFKNQEKQIAHTEKLIEKFRAKASKATMAQALIKKLDRMERVVVDVTDNSTLKLNFTQAVQPGKVVLALENISKNYGPKQVLQEVSLQVNRGDKIAFVGQNGQGKSTLAKIIVGEVDFQGSCTLGHNVQVGYFAQNQAEYLDGQLTVEDTLLNAANEETRPRVRDILGAFLFRGEEVEKYVRVLSGGERNRLALAKLLLQPLNVLVMDEPTNHLDIASKQVLKEALKSFQGTLIVVSHDRDFLQGLTDKVFEFREQRIKEYLGDINFFLEQRNLGRLQDAAKTHKAVTTVKTPQVHNANYQTQKQIKALQNKLSNLEKKITALEKTLKEIDLQLELNYGETIAQPDFFDTYQEKKQMLSKHMEAWESLADRLDSLQNALN